MLPARKVSKPRKRNRRSHHALAVLNLSRCSQCGQAKLPHAACDNCGYVNPQTKLELEKTEES